MEAIKTLEESSRRTGNSQTRIVETLILDEGVRFAADVERFISAYAKPRGISRAAAIERLLVEAIEDRLAREAKPR